jgi:ABC-type uncharacterized transport system permease subunit
MFELPKNELIVFIFVIALYLAAGLVGVVQLRPQGKKYQAIMPHFFSLAIIAEIVILVFRALAIKAIPLTGLFESMLVLTLVLGIIYLALGIVIRQVWFGSVMSWVVLVLIMLTCVIAEPASEAYEFAARPWTIAHGLAMVFGAAMLLLAAVTAYVYLLGCRRLKHKEIAKVIGKVPNIQKLERINLIGLKAAFIFVTIGATSGIGGAWLERGSLQIELLDFLWDSKILGSLITWLLLLLVLTAHYLRLIKGKRTAQTTLVAFVWILFAFVGCTILCDTKHDFSSGSTPGEVQNRETDK